VTIQYVDNTDLVSKGRARDVGWLHIGQEIKVRTRGFGELEAVIMDRVWSRRPEAAMTVRDICDELCAERRIAYTTVMSTMDNLHTKGWLARTRDGKAYRYRPTLTREQHSARLMCEALDGGGQAELVLGYFLEQIGPEKSARLRTALGHRRAKR
jgi:predicted transcriptional regulator